MSYFIRSVHGTPRQCKSQAINSIQFNIPNTMSLIKTWLLEQQRREFKAGQAEYKTKYTTEYTQDQQFVLNDIANEQEQIMQELMSEEVTSDAYHHRR
jgi:hypothetical protein